MIAADQVNSLGVVAQKHHISLLTFLLGVQLALVFVVDYGVLYIDGFPRVVTFFPEALAGVLLVAGLLTASSQSLIQMPGRYVVWLLVVGALFIVGVFVNNVESGAIFYGARVYFRYLPFLLLPILVSFPLRECYLQLKFVLILAFLQLPFTLYQFFFIFGTRGNDTGDVVRGTLSNSGLLTMFLMMALIVWTSLYIKRRIKFGLYIFGAPLIVIPSWLNETTSVLLLLPLALLLPIFLDRNSPGKFMKAITALLVLGILMGGFIVTYSNNFSRWGGDVTNVFFDERGAISYLYKGADHKSRADGSREQSEIGRIDSVVMPFLVLDDPVHLSIGIGLGNSSRTSNRTFEGEFSDVNMRYGVDLTTYSALIWEFGLIGLTMSFFLMFMVYRDGMKLSKRMDGVGAIGLAAASIMVFLIVAFGYKNIVISTQLSSSLALLVGHIIKFRMTDSMQRRPIATPSDPNFPIRS